MNKPRYSVPKHLLSRPPSVLLSLKIHHERIKIGQRYKAGQFLGYGLYRKVGRFAEGIEEERSFTRELKASVCTYPPEEVMECAFTLFVYSSLKLQSTSTEIAALNTYKFGVFVCCHSLCDSSELFEF